MLPNRSKCMLISIWLGMLQLMATSCGNWLWKTNHASLTSSDRIKGLVAQGNVKDIVFLDFIKDFNKLFHDILLNKMVKMCKMMLLLDGLSTD